VVVDKYGGGEGIVSYEDILEVVMQAIHDGVRRGSAGRPDDQMSG
jgi:CBS domain containing-hemolysin-like protein